MQINPSWPSHVKKLIVYTKVVGGFGDLSCASKLITILKELKSDIQIDWIVEGRKDPLEKAKQFIHKDVCLRSSPYEKKYEADLLITAPSKSPITKILESKFNFHVKERFSLYECAEQIPFQNRNEKSLVLGLKTGSGVFIDKTMSEKINLSHLKDETLKEQIGKASLNFGYAHHTQSWKRFIQCVLIHESEKDCVILLNQRSEFHLIKTKWFLNLIDSKTLIKWKVKELRIKGSDEEYITILQESGRVVTLIVREKFDPEDMKKLLNASDRILATGDNTACEAWSTGCSLYLYEEVNYGGCKAAFLRQQIELAHAIYPPLSELLSLFGKIEPWTKNEAHRVEMLLKDPLLAKQTKHFCTVIRNHFNVSELLKKTLLNIAQKL